MKHELTSYQTKRALADALKLSMKKKSFSKISVSELVTACNVNRKTFYYHFPDIFALLKWMMAEETFSIVNQYNLLTDYEEAIRFAVEYVATNDYIVSCAYDSVAREEMKRFFYQNFVTIVDTLIDSVLEEKNITLDENVKSFFVKYHSEAFLSMLVDFAQNIEKQNKDDTIQNLLLIVRSTIGSINFLK